ncbi:YALIA101S15e00782g1_1 [Yarrowia lipolytica]|jgi:ribonuclease HI|nr:Ribonuclease H1 [Yarrowia lipolytica]SEI36906.1 YALIA101S15e00782g1_1 [Yarrowia lipolytica]
MKNFHAVRVGYTTGIYEDVEDAKDEIRGYSCAEWKGFNRYADALEYMYENPNVTKYYVWEDLVFDEIDIAHQYSGGESCEVFFNLEDARGEAICEYGNCNERLREDLLFVDAEGDTVYEVYTDGACIRNGKRDARAGCGVYFGANNPFNESKILGGTLQTNQRAELVAIKRALQLIQEWVNGEYYEIYTDSDYALKCVTEWCDKWERNGWVNCKGYPVSNQDTIKDILKLLNSVGCRNVLGIEKVLAHSDCEGNNGADELARDAAERHYYG